MSQSPFTKKWQGSRERWSLRAWIALVALTSVPVVNAAEPQAKPTSDVKASTEKTETSSKTEAAQSGLGLKLIRHTLPNGLRVVLNPDESSPTVAVAVTYDVGSRNEVEGRSGFAHLFEHLMFQGSRNLAKGDHFALISTYGGELNGTTSSDRTNYYEQLPETALELALWLEADRMRSLAVNQENFENQRSVVQEEYRMRVSNAAYAQGLMTLHELIFEGYWPYSHDAIGSMADLDAAKLEWIREFHNQYYAPNNAVLSISGKLDPTKTLALINQHFGAISKKEIKAYAPPKLPESTPSRSKKIEDSNIRTPGIYLGWRIPPYGGEEHYALELVTVLLGSGETARYESELVRDKELAQAVSVWTHDNRGPDAFVIQAVAQNEAKLPELRQALLAQLEKLAKEPVSQKELDKAKNRITSSFLFGLEGTTHRATQLGEYETYFGDANRLNSELSRYQSITPEVLQRAVAKYLTLGSLNEVIVNPTQASPATETQKP